MNKHITYRLLCILVLFMPLHYYICELFLKGTSVDNLFRDFLIIVLFMMAAFDRGIIRTNKIGMLILTNCIILIIYALVSYFIWGYQGTFNILRTYLLPIMIFFICYTYKFKIEEFKKLQKMMMIEMVIIGIYGVFQAFILGDQFAIKLGYGSYAGHLNSTSFYIGGFYGYQRNTGTFVSPNVCGAVLMVVLIVHLLDSRKYIMRGRNLITFLLAVGVVATFSRSSMVGGIASLLFCGMVSGRLFRINKNGKRILWIFPAAAAAIAIVWYVDQRVLGGLFTRMVQSSWHTSISGTDSSLQKHIEDLYKPMLNVIRYPFGMGFGSNGPMSIVLNSNARNFESSVYLMLYEIGIIPAILFFTPYLAVIISTIKNKNYKYYVPAAISVCYLTIYLILPSVQTFELPFYVFMYIGFYYNSSVKSMYNEQTDRSN